MGEKPYYANWDTWCGITLDTIERIQAITSETIIAHWSPTSDSYQYTSSTDE
jgi:hypothetical protein